MRPYTFYIHERGHEAPAFDFVHCVDQSDAQDHARLLLDRFPEYDEIEIYDGDAWRNRIGRLEPSAPAAS